MRVDAHHHFWDPARAEYPWMTDELAAIRRRFGPEDLHPVLEANGIDRSILVQTRSSEEETLEFLTTAAENDFIAGVIGWVDLTAADVASRIAKLRAGPGGRKLVGIRHQVQDERDPRWLRRHDVRRGLDAAADAGLVYDLLVRARELPAARETVREHRSLRFVVDHVAKPPIRTGDDQAWEDELAALSELPNVTCKLSGLVTEADWRAWRVEQLAPYVRRAVNWFGPERCLFGSDWPVCLVAASYGRVLGAIEAALDDRSSRDRGRIFGGTAVEVYQLAVPTSFEPAR